MILGKRTKQPGETKLYDVTYEDWLATGETLTGVTVAVACLTDQDDDVLTATATAVSPAVRVTAVGGTAGQTYKLTLTLTTSLGQIDEDEIIVAVRDY